MRNFLVLLFTIFLFSCNDGDFDSPSFNFDDVSIENCGNLVLFKINESEVLLLNLNVDNYNNNFFKTAYDNEVFSLSDAIIYRTYSANVTASMFCQNIPPSSPSLQKEWLGNGTLIVNNTITDNGNGTSSYICTFTINDLQLNNQSGNSIIYDVYDYGAVVGSFDN